MLGVERVLRIAVGPVVRDDSAAGVGVGDGGVGDGVGVGKVGVGVSAGGGIALLLLFQWPIDRLFLPGITFREAIERLGEDDREIVLMRHFEQLSNSEAAQALGLTPAAAGMRHLRALRRLKGELEDSPSS